ncbi:FliM/FliN family flagellar motor switch protein [Pandoraea sputorum]|nr:FliM/FliN family flagellar motor switch protein [Pandoraea sputorum]
MAPQLAIHAWTQVPAELLPLVAGWTLAPLDGWWQQLGGDALCEPEVRAGDAPPPGWRFTLQDGARRLPLYVQEAPARVLQALLAALEPSPEQHHELALALGWCQLAGDALAQVAVGDALPVLGMAESLDTLWLHPEASPGQLQLRDAQLAVVAPAPVPLADDLPDTVRLAVEVGRARVSAAALAAWTPGADVPLDARAHVALRLTQGERLWGQGQLLRLDDGWAVRLDARAD